MAGKSTLLRQVGLCVPARPNGVIRPRAAGGRRGGQAVHAVGASDNLVRGQSTFMVEMSETSAILHGATGGAWCCSMRSGGGLHLRRRRDRLAVTEFLHNTMVADDLRDPFHVLTSSPISPRAATSRWRAPRPETRSCSCTGSSRRRRPLYGIHVAGSQGCPPAVVSSRVAGARAARSGSPRGAADAARTSRCGPARPVQPVGKPASAAQGARSARRNALSPLEALNRLAA